MCLVHSSIFAELFWRLAELPSWVIPYLLICVFAPVIVAGQFIALRERRKINQTSRHGCNCHYRKTGNFRRN